MLPLHPFEKIAKKAGVRRISRLALEELRDTIEELGLDIARQAVEISRHAQRRTVKKRDIKFIVKH
jgi:histone H3/H4